MGFKWIAKQPTFSKAKAGSNPSQQGVETGILDRIYNMRYLSTTYFSTTMGVEVYPIGTSHFTPQTY